jgi:2,4-dienoyl-CoA reductase-like NADH-dependent reductase (Old Yellow Enzyme family)
MAPLTRVRAGDARIPNPLMAEYYAQRADAGLIIGEATSVMPTGVGYAATPGIWSAEQVAGWRLVTDAVHKAGGRIFMQLWHVGRISDPSFLNGQPPVAPSAIAAKGHVSLLRPERPYPTPRALETHEIPEIVAPIAGGRPTPGRRVSTASRFTAPTAICWISSFRTRPTAAPTLTAVRWRTAPA